MRSFRSALVDDGEAAALDALEYADAVQAADDADPSPATHAILTVLNAGEHFCRN